MHNLHSETLQPEMEISNQEYGYELSPEFEYNEFENEAEGNYELSPEFETSYETGNYETYEMELAHELMEVTNEAEFFDWVKSTAKKAAGVASGFIDSPTGQQAVATLSNIAQKTLPKAGAAGGSWLGKKGGEALGGAIAGAFTEGAGAPIGKAIGGWAGSKLGAWGGEKAGQWAADRVPAFVRFTSDTIRNLANEVASKGPRASVKSSVVKAASKHYPIILQVKGTLHARKVQNGMDKEYENEYNGEYGMQGETYGEISNMEGTFNEVTEMELASELLTLQSEAELDQFLGKLFKKAVGAVKSFAKSGVGKALGGVLKKVAKTALPIAGKALGTFVAPGIGTAVGGALGNAASNLFELELEGLSAEDREFELARAYVRFAGNAARRAAQMPNMHPGRAAQSAVVQSARRFAPGLLNRRSRQYRPRYASYKSNTYNDYSEPTASQNNGTWFREGDQIILQGV
jgi:uncharacterized protein (DUF697 family)